MNVMPSLLNHGRFLQSAAIWYTARQHLHSLTFRRILNAETDLLIPWLGNRKMFNGVCRMKLSVFGLSVIASTLVVMSCWAQDGPGYAHTGNTIISGIRVIDGLGNDPVDNQDIVIVDGKIAAIGIKGSLESPAGALMIDGKGLTALPGLIDMHVHINIMPQ